MAGIDTCNTCQKKVLQHSFHLKCYICTHLVHLKCLPCVNKSDYIFNNRDANIWYCTKCTESLLPYNHIFDDSDFMDALSENWNSVGTSPINRIDNQEKLFHPFELNENESHPLSDCDPDIQFYNNQVNSDMYSCDYFMEDSFNNIIGREGIRQDSFSILHANIRSAVKNLNSFEAYLANIDHKFKIIALTESWLKDNNSALYNIDGYNSEHRCRPVRGGGGVSLYIHESLEYFLRDDICINNSNLESLFIEIQTHQKCKTQNDIVGVVYRPPDTDMNAFNQHLESLLQTLHSEKKNMYLLGDWNINVLNADKHAPSQYFLNLMYSHNLFPGIIKPTRVTKNLQL